MAKDGGFGEDEGALRFWLLARDPNSHLCESSAAVNGAGNVGGLYSLLVTSDSHFSDNKGTDLLLVTSAERSIAGGISSIVDDSSDLYTESIIME